MIILSYNSKNYPDAVTHGQPMGSSWHLIITGFGVNKNRCASQNHASGRIAFKSPSDLNFPSNCLILACYLNLMKSESASSTTACEPLRRVFDLYPSVNYL
jgi:hypothetical protein